MPMRNKSRTIAEISIFSAIIIVLQLLATYIKIGSFSINLTLIPIIVAGCVYGESIGTLMGLVSATIIIIMVLTGGDPSGATMLSYNPLATIAAVYVKGALSGFIPSYIYRKLENKNQKLAVMLSAASCPIINTFTFTIFLILFFDTPIKALIGYFLTTNFVIELVINLLVAPRLTGLIKHNKERYM